MDAEGKAFFLAKSAYDDTFYPEAQTQLRQLLEKFPRTRFRIEIYYLLGQCSLSRNEWDRAQTYFRRILRAPENPFQERALNFLSQSYYSSGKDLLAIESARQLLKKFPLTGFAGSARLGIAKSYRRTGRQSEALRALEKMAKDFAGKDIWGWAIVEQASIYQQANNLDKVVDLLSGVSESKSNPLKPGELELWLADTLSRLGRDREALTLYDSALGQASSDLVRQRATFNKARSQRILRDVPGAKSSYKNLLKRYAHSYSARLARLGMARLALDNAEVETARKILAQIPALSAEDRIQQEASLLRADAALMAKEYNNAIFLYWQFLHAYVRIPCADAARYKIALCYFYLGKYEECARTALDALSLPQPGAPKIRYRIMLIMGDAQSMLERWPEAALIYRRILKQFDEDNAADEIFYRLGYVLYEQQQWAQASLPFEQIVEQHAQSRWMPMALYRLGWIAFRLGEYIKAANYFHELAQKFPQDVYAEQALFQEAACLYRLGNFASAQEAYETLLKNYPKGELRERAMLESAWTLANGGRDKEAAETFEGFGKEFPASPLAPQAWFWLGQARLAQGDFSVALGYFDRILKEQPKSELADDALFCSAITLARWGRHQESNELLQKLSAKDPSNDFYEDALFAMADNEAALKHYGRAVSLFSRALSEAAGDPMHEHAATLRIADCYFAKGEFKQSLAWYSKLENIPDKGIEAQARFKKSICLEALGAWDQTKDELMHLLYEQDMPRPWTDKAALKLGEIFQREDRNADALVLYEKLSKQAGEEGEMARRRMDSIRVVGKDLARDRLPVNAESTR